MSTRQDRRGFLKLGVTAGTGLVLGGTSLAKDSQTQEEMTIFDVFKKRRSVRKFKSTPVPKEHITKILETANCAPSSGNAQNWKFLVIRDRKKLNQLKEECIARYLELYKKNRKALDPKKLEEKREWAKQHYEDYLSAPVYIEVLVDNRKWSKLRDSQPDYFTRYTIKDGTLAASILLLAARALGYGTVFCTDTIPENLTQKMFNIPDHYTRICITPVGIPDKWPECPQKKGLDEKVVYEKFQ